MSEDKDKHERFRVRPIHPGVQYELCYFQTLKGAQTKAHREIEDDSIGLRPQRVLIERTTTPPFERHPSWAIVEEITWDKTNEKPIVTKPKAK